MESAWVPAKRDFQAERDVVCVKGGFQAVRQHPLNVELKRETTAVAGKAVAPVVKKPVIVSKGKSPLDDPLSAFGAYSCGVFHLPGIASLGGVLLFVVSVCRVPGACALLVSLRRLSVSGASESSSRSRACVPCSAKM